MASLTTNEKQALEKLFQMEGGSVLNFTHRTMAEFFRDDIGIDISDEKYAYASGSKANLMRGFWQVADNFLVAKSIEQAIEYLENQILIGYLLKGDFPIELIKRGKEISHRPSNIHTDGQDIKSTEAQKGKSVKRYYSLRHNKEKNTLDIEGLRTIFAITCRDLNSRHYFDEHLGLDCTNGFISGHVGPDVDGYIFKKLRKNGLWPIHENVDQYSQDDIFDLIEFLFDHISKPLEKDSYYHDWNQCGYHYEHFDKTVGQSEFIEEINQFLNDFAEGFELSVSGEILILGEPEFRQLLESPVPTDEKENITAKIDLAKNKFRRYGSTLEERADAVRLLADCLEYLQPQLKSVLNNKDESDLFNIANNFGIRHHNTKQQNNYDKNIWLSWMFYFYLATLHACIRLINKKVGNNQ